MGTELVRRGLSLPPPLWSARALDEAEELVAAIHADYAAAGARIHTANTFRTDPYSLRKAGREGDWQNLTAKALAIARSAVPSDHRVLGSLSPLEDCYRPDLSPPRDLALAEHGCFARGLAAAGADGILCETFPHKGEALLAVEAAVATGLPVWLSLTLGPSGDLMEPAEVVDAAREAVERGVEAILLNCSPVPIIAALLPKLAELGVTVGAYANVGHEEPAGGWLYSEEDSPAAYIAAALGWAAAGATILGGCCGTKPEHIRALAQAVSVAI